MRMIASEMETTEATGEIRQKSRVVAARKSRLRRMTIEGLEARTLLATLPASSADFTTLSQLTGSALTGGGNLSSTAGGGGSSTSNESSPQIVVDRYDPNKLVAVWVRNDPAVFTGTTKIVIAGAFSNDGGNTWRSFNAAPNMVNDPNSAPTNILPFAQVTDPSVAFNANHEFYILVSQHSADTTTSGALVLSKFDFSGNAPQSETFYTDPLAGGPAQSQRVLYEWASGVDPAVRPTLAVDDNLASFTDPTTSQVQTDPFSNTIYVAYGLNETVPTGPAANNYNPNTVRLIASADGGQSFTNPQLLNDNGHSNPSHAGSPRIAISQGRLANPAVYGPGDTGVPGGQVTVVWDDFGVGSQASPPFDRIVSSRITDGGQAVVVPNVGGTINNGTNTDFTKVINFSDPSFFLNNLTVKLNITSPNLDRLSAVLIGPDGTQVTLFLNHTTAGGAQINNQGLQGTNMGLAPFGSYLGTVIDDNAGRNINVSQTPGGSYVGTFQPERGALSIFTGFSAARLSGTWILRITDFGSTAAQTLRDWTLNFTGGATDQLDVPVGNTTVRGNAIGNFPLGSPATPLGIGPTPVIASDNSLGSFSQFQGRLYIAYVTHDNSFNANPALNTDIALYTSDDAGQSWQLATNKVNDDDGTVDGYSGAITGSSPLNASNEVWGRTQYMPAIAVDSATGTLVLSWRDARNDPSNARVATYMTTSISGGASFSPDIFVNPQQTSTDAITGKSVLQGPLPDNESSSAGPDTAFSYGDRMGLAVFNGKAYPVWSGNFDQPVSLSQFTVGAKLDIYSNPVTFAAGPRIIDSTMGPVGGPGDSLNQGTAANGTPRPDSIIVTFDRPIDPAGDPNNKTFLTSAVEVFYNSPVAGTAPVPLFVTLVSPMPTGTRENNGEFGYTRWLINFDPTKNADGSSRGTNLDFTGTYSYLIKPSISDRIRSEQLGQVTLPPITLSAAPNSAIPPSGAGGSGVFQNDATSSIITIPSLPGVDNRTIQSMTVNLTLTHTQDSDLSIYILGPAATVNMATGTITGAFSQLFQDFFTGDKNITNVTFSDQAATPITLAGGNGTFNGGTFRPVTPLAGLAGQQAAGQYRLLVVDNQANNVGTLVNWSISVTASTSGALLVNPGNKMDQNADGVTNQDATVTPFFGMTPGDVYAIPTPAPTAATNFNLQGNKFPQGPYNQNTLPLIVSGPRIIATTIPSPGYQVGSGDNLVMNDTVSSMNVTYDRDMYVNTAAPNDPKNFSASNVLRIMGPVGLITGPQTFALPTALQGQTIPAGTGAPLNSAITVPSDNNTFKIAHLSVLVNITDSSNTPLTGFLVAPDGTKVQLFANLVGSNLTNTLFDDAAINAIGAGSPPYTGTFQPLSPLSQFNGKDLASDSTQGTWTLQVINSRTGNAATLNSWSLIATPQITVTPKMDGATPGTTRTYEIGFPQQQLSGTYTIDVGPNAYSALIGPGGTVIPGDAQDQSRNAGVDALRGTATSVPTAPVTYNAPSLPRPIPDATKNAQGVVTPGTLVSTITIPQSQDFLIQGITAAGLSGVTVHLDITHQNDPDLQAVLIYNLGQPDELRLPLFTNVGSGPNHSNFSNTTFDDQANTPIQNGGAPFFGTYNPQAPLLSSSIYGPGLVGLHAAGTWTLQVQDTNQNTVGTLNSWSISFQKPLPTTGLGEPNTDNASEGFRIFTMDPTNPVASNTWTAVGPASIGGSRSGRIGGMAVDPSDPSGNTVFIGGASGGVWKTTNFLTTDPNGPTYVPVTNFGPTFGFNIGGIAVFPRNNDPRQSIVIAATGEGDTGSRGVGFLISKDGGATWNLYDSTVNTDSSGNLLPINSALRDHLFVGTTSAFKVVVDPKLTPDGNVIIYAAFSGTNGGVWRSLDTGNTWQLLRAGQATDVILAPNSGTSGNGSLQIIYAGFRGEGVFMSPNGGQVWNLMAGGVGNPLIINSNAQNVNPASQPSPNGAFGRIQLVTPFLTGNPVRDAVYEGWLYAVVITPDSHMRGVYLTKDFGRNWTQVRIPTLPPVGPAGRAFPQAVPSNDVGLNDYDIGGGPAGSGFGAQGNYDVSLAIDPTNPNIIYLGGTADAQSTGFLRIDSTTIWDAHSLVYGGTILNDGGQLVTVSNGPIQLIDPTKGGPTPYTNFIRGPLAPFVSDQTQVVPNAASFINNGAGVKWIPFDIGGTDQHRIITMVDPLTGHARIIIGDDQGVYTAVDNNGTFDAGIGNAQSPAASRNGNLQITQFYYGASQPSSLAAQVAGALFYGSAQDDGGPRSDPNVLNNGNITWNGPGGDASGVNTDQQGSGTFFQYWWPCCGPDPNHATNFFLVNGVGATTGLLQQSNGLPTPDPQWPSLGGSNFAVNPINANQIIMSSQAGRIFATQTQGLQWFPIAEPSVLDGTYAPALAYGAPDPNAPGGIGNLGNFLYVGTNGGHIYMSRTGGGGAGNAWADISLGLNGASIQQIITDPSRGSHDAYAVTTSGVFYLPDSVALANNPTNAALGWQNITGPTLPGGAPAPNNIFGIMHNIFGNTNFSETLTKGGPGESGLPNGGLTTVQADWRYVIPADPTRPVGPTNPTHPVLYVGGGSGVYVSLDNGQTWSLFPNVAFNGSPADGGFLPTTQVTQLNVVLGNVDPTTGRAVQRPGDPNLLLATTFGTGSYGIRLAPIVFPNTATSPNSITLDPTKPAPNGSSNGTAPNGLPLVTTSRPFLNGLSEQSAFGNNVRITLLDLTDPLNPRYIGGFDGTFGDASDVAANRTDAFGKFSVQVNTGAFTANGTKTIGIQATDASGTKGNIATFSFQLQASDLGQPNPPAPPTLALLFADDSSHGQNVTNVTQPHFVGTTDPNVTVELLDAGGVPIQLVDPGNPTGPGVFSVTSDPLTGAFSLQPKTALVGNPATQYSFKARATNTFGSSSSPAVNVTVKTVGPANNNFLGLSPADDSGVKGDNVTTVRHPHFIGTTDAGALVDLVNVANGVVLATGTADVNGNYSVQLPQNLANGSITLETRAHDVAGNQGPLSSSVQVTIGSVRGDYNVIDPGTNLAGSTEAALFQRTNSTTMTWLVDKGVTSAAGVAFGQGALDIPFAGDFNGDGVTDLAYYEPSSMNWVLQLSVGTTIASGNIRTIHLNATANSIPFVGDFDGDGVTDVGVYKPGQGATPSTWIINESSGGLQTFTFGQAGDQPVPGNYDGTGADELAVYRPSTGQFLIAGAGGTPANPTVVTIGTPNLVPVPGNYNNQFYFDNGQPQRMDVAVYNPSTGAFTIGRWSGTSTITTRTDTGPASGHFQAGDIPAPGNYDGTGDYQAAVYRPSTGQFIVNGTTGVVSLGQPGAVYTPVLAPYVYRQIPVVTVAPTIALSAADDTGVPGDNITKLNRPHMVGTTSPGAVVDLINNQTGAVIGTATADANGNYSVQPTNALPNGVFKLQARAHGLGAGPSFLSPVVTVTVQTSLAVTSTSPGNGTLVTSLPNGQVVVKFNHTLQGLTPDNPAAFAGIPFSVMLIPSGPDGGARFAAGLPLWTAPSGLDDGDLPVPATLVYHANADGTSQITLTPAFPLSTDIYLIQIGGLTDVAGNQVGGTGVVFASFDYHASAPNNSALQVVGVTANHGSTVINNNQIPQPDTIAIQFNKALSTWTVNDNTVHLLAKNGSTYVAVPAAVAFSPSTNSIYLTPEAILTPGTVYVISVDGSVADDQSFPQPGVKLGQAFNTSFTVGNAAVTGQSPLALLQTSPANGTPWLAPLGYVSATFSEQLNMNSLGRFSAMLVPHTGGVTTGTSGYADVPMNAKVAFNPNTNQLIIIPTQLLGNSIYLVALAGMSATNGDSLGNAPVYSTFQLGAPAAQAHAVKSSQSAGLAAVTADSSPSAVTTATTTTAAPTGGTTVVNTSSVTPSVRSTRPAQKARAHDHALGGFNVRSLRAARRKALASALDHLDAERN